MILLRFEEFVQNWYQIITCVKIWYQIITVVKNWYLIVTDVSDKTVKKWNWVQYAADLVGEEYACMLYVIWLRAYFLKMCEILVRNLWRIGTIFSRAVGNWYQFFTVWNLRSLKFAVQQAPRSQWFLKKIKQNRGFSFNVRFFFTF